MPLTALSIIKFGAVRAVLLLTVLHESLPIYSAFFISFAKKKLFQRKIYEVIVSSMNISPVKPILTACTFNIYCRICMKFGIRDLHLMLLMIFY